MQQQDPPESIPKVSVLWRGNKFILEMNSHASLQDLGHELQKLTHVKADTMRLIVPQFSSKSSKLLYPFSDEHSSLNIQDILMGLEGKTIIRMMGVPEAEITEILKSEKADLRIAGFDEEDLRLKRRILGRPAGPIKLPKGAYIFADFRTLDIPGVQLNPPPSEALKKMHKLAADPGIVAIMNKHRWRVGIMTEMAPVGYVGVSPKCILGFNKNHGEEISLRLRTDDLKGFRKYESIKKTLLHELAHMVYSEHDANFYALDRQLNQEAASLDWTRTQSQTLNGSKSYYDYEEDEDSFDTTSMPLKVGGITVDHLASARETSVAAASRRLASYSTSNVVSGVHAEPDPDDSGFNSPMKETMDENIHSQMKLDLEPDPDCSGSWITLKPNPDDSQGTSIKRTNVQQKLESEPDPDDYSDSRRNFEPDPDDSYGTDIKRRFDSWGNETKGSVPLPAHEESADSGILAEPDPDDSSGIHERVQSREIVSESDLDNSEAKESDLRHRSSAILAAEPVPDDHLGNFHEVSGMQIDEPDPDEQERLLRIQDPVTALCSRMQKAIDILRTEVDSAEVSRVLLTLVKIIGNVIEHPHEMKYKRLRKNNPSIQKNVVRYKAAMEIMTLVGFNEDITLDENGRAETYLVLKRDDPGLLWLAKSSIETVMAC